MISKMVKIGFSFLYEELVVMFPGYYREPDPHENEDFRPIDACKGVEMPACLRRFHVIYVEGGGYDVDLGGPKDHYGVLDALDKLGFRPALYEELLCFSKEMTAEELKEIGSLRALGSEGFMGTRATFAWMWEAEDGRRLEYGYFDNLRINGGYYLAVRK